MCKVVHRITAITSNHRHTYERGIRTALHSTTLPQSYTYTSIIYIYIYMFIGV